MGLYNQNYKFLFSHVSKCGGSSLISGLKSVTNETSIVCPYHCGLDYIYKNLRLANENPKKYIKISSVRNPWDRAVSLYYHLLGNEKRLLTVLDKSTQKTSKIMFTGNFDDFIRKVMTNIPQNYYENFSHVIKFEELQKGFDTICKTINVDSIELPIINYKTGRPLDYRSMYNPSSAEFIYKKNKNIVDTFGYTF